MTINQKTSLTGYQLRTGLKAAKGDGYYKKAETALDARQLNSSGCADLCFPATSSTVLYDAKNPENNQCYCIN